MHDHVVESALRILLSSWMVLCTSAINACMSSSCWPHPLGKSAQVRTIIRGIRIINTHTMSQNHNTIIIIHNKSCMQGLSKQRGGQIRFHCIVTGSCNTHAHNTECSIIISTLLSHARAFKRRSVGNSSLEGAMELKLAHVHIYTGIYCTCI